MSNDATSADTDQPGGAIARDVSISEQRILADRLDVLLLDVRTDKEWQDGHLLGAAFPDFLLEDDFTAVALTLPRTQPIALYCAAGGRSEDAMKRLSKAGFTELYNLRGGFYDWEGRGSGVHGPPRSPCQWRNDSLLPTVEQGHAQLGHLRKWVLPHGMDHVQRVFSREGKSNAPLDSSIGGRSRLPSPSHSPLEAAKVHSKVSGSVRPLG